MTVEKRILLVYPSAVYFFVSHDNTQLGRALEKGLRTAIKDGSFDELFFNHPMIKQALKMPTWLNAQSII